MNRPAKCILITGSSFLLLAVIIGAFGAHGLKDLLTESYLKTYKTGVSYQFYHGLAILFLGLLQLQLKEIKFSLPAIFFTIGIFLFSFNCYIYSVSHIKIFAMIIPLGGVCFILGWIILLLKLKSIPNSNV